MHRRAIVLLALVLAACGFAVAPASAAGAFAVTLSSSRSVADVGQVTVLTGKVSGKGAGKKKVRIEQRIGTGAWQRLGTATTTKKGKYSFKATVTSAGTVSYRVVAPKSKKVAAGTSATATLATWRWLDLYDQPYLTGGGVVSRGAYESTTIGGVKPPAHTFGMGQDAYLYWNFDQKCDRVVAQVGMSNSDLGTTRTVRFQLGAVATEVQVVGGDPLKGFANLTTSSFSSFRVSRPDASYAYLVLPRAHCKVNGLPVASD